MSLVGDTGEQLALTVTILSHAWKTIRFSVLAFRPVPGSLIIWREEKRSDQSQYIWLAKGLFGVATKKVCSAVTLLIGCATVFVRNPIFFYLETPCHCVCGLSLKLNKLPADICIFLGSAAGLVKCSTD